MWDDIEPTRNISDWGIIWAFMGSFSWADQDIHYIDVWSDYYVYDFDWWSWWYLGSDLDYHYNDDFALNYRIYFADADYMYLWYVVGNHWFVVNEGDYPYITDSDAWDICGG